MTVLNNFNRRPVPRPPRPFLSVVMRDTLKRRLAVMCAELGCVAIEATALWDEDGQLIVGEGAAAAVDTDITRLRTSRRLVGLR